MYFYQFLFYFTGNEENEYYLVLKLIGSNIVILNNFIIGIIVLFIILYIKLFDSIAYPNTINSNTNFLYV